MTQRPAHLPALRHPAARAVVIGRWRVTSSEEQRLAADLSIDSWRTTPWPPGLLAHHCLLGESGDTLVHYSQWTHEDAFRSLPHPGGSKERWDTLGAALPTLERTRPALYVHQRSFFGQDADVTPACVVLVRFDVDEPGLQRTLVDGFVAAVEESVRLEGGSQGLVGGPFT